MSQKVDELLRLMEAGEEKLTARIVQMLDGDEDPGRLGEAYSMWVLPSALLVFAARDETPEIHGLVQEASEQVEESLQQYLDNPGREALVSLASDWMAARAAGHSLIEALSA